MTSPNDPNDPYTYASSDPFIARHDPNAPYGAPAEYGQGFPNQVPAQPLVTIGDITCTQYEVITPSGTFPIAGSQWAVTDMSVTTERMSQTGLVLALVGFFLVCFLSLLFLLMKDRQTTGYIQVSVRGRNGVQHVTNIPAFSPATMMDVSARVNYARGLAAMA
ncbi:hypothetical protein GCM10009624_03950 [Gordonia sinesedis]